MNANENFLASDSDYNLEKKQKRNKKKRHKVNVVSIWHRNKVFSIIKCLSSVAVKVILVRRSLQLKCVSFTPASPLFYDSCICSAIQTILYFILKRFQFFLTRWTEIFLSLIAGHFYHRLFPVLYFLTVNSICSIVTQRKTLPGLLLFPWVRICGD